MLDSTGKHGMVSRELLVTNSGVQTGTFKSMSLEAWVANCLNKSHRCRLSFPIKQTPTLLRLPFIHLTYGQMYEQSYARAECILAIPISRLRPFRQYEFPAHPVRIDRKGHGDLVNALNFPKGSLIFGTYEDHCDLCVTKNERFTRYPHNPLLGEHIKEIHDSAQLVIDIRERERNLQEIVAVGRTQDAEYSLETGQQLVDNSEPLPGPKALVDLAGDLRAKPARIAETLPNPDIEVPLWSSLPIYDNDFTHITPKTRRDRRLEKKAAERRLNITNSCDDRSSGSDLDFRYSSANLAKTLPKVCTRASELEVSAENTRDAAKDHDLIEPLVEDEQLEQVDFIAETESHSANPLQTIAAPTSLGDEYLAAIKEMGRKLDLLHFVDAGDPRAPYLILELMTAIDDVIEKGDAAMASWDERSGAKMATESAQTANNSSSAELEIKAISKLKSNLVSKPKTKSSRKANAPAVPKSTIKPTRNDKSCTTLKTKTTKIRKVEPAQTQQLNDSNDRKAKQPATLYVGIVAVVLLVSTLILLYQIFLWSIVKMP